MSKYYTREDLTRQASSDFGRVTHICDLCDQESNEGSDIIGHENDCPLFYQFVVGVTVDICSAPHPNICEGCPACEVPCAVMDWREETHELLQKACSRYAAIAEEHRR